MDIGVAYTPDPISWNRRSDDILRGHFRQYIDRGEMLSYQKLESGKVLRRGRTRAEDGYSMMEVLLHTCGRL